MTRKNSFEAFLFGCVFFERDFKVFPASGRLLKSALKSDPWEANRHVSPPRSIKHHIVNENEMSAVLTAGTSTCSGQNSSGVKQASMVKEGKLDGWSSNNQTSDVRLWAAFTLD